MDARKTLWELSCFSRELETALEKSGGELSEELEVLLNNVQSNLQNKIDGCDYALTRLESLEEIWKKRADEASQVRKSYAAAQERLKSLIRYAMSNMGKDEIKGDLRRFVLTDTRSLKIDENSLPESYKLVVTTHVPDKERIKADLDKGISIPGAEYANGSSLRRYNNRS